MCVPTLFSACGDLIGKLTCQNRCNFRCCTRDHVEVHINGPVDDKVVAIAGPAIDGGPPPEPIKDEGDSGGIPPVVTKLLGRFRKKASPVSADGASSAGGGGNGEIGAVPLQPFRVYSASRGEGAGRRVTALDVSAVEPIVLTDLTQYLFRVLKQEEDDAVFINIYKFSQDMVNEIRTLFENPKFLQELKDKREARYCSIETMELLTQFEAKYQTVLLAAKKICPNP